MKTILTLVAAAVVGYLVWNHYFSKSAQIERAYAACMKKFDSGMSQATANVKADAPSGNDPSAALAKGMSDAMTSMVQGLGAAMGGATCGAIRETCRQDFDGPLCQAARNGR